MARKERFALPMEDGAQVRNIDDFKAHFDIGSVVRDFCNGKLLTWLEDRYYDEEADAVRNLSSDDKDFQEKLAAIFGVETPEKIAWRNERLNRLKKYTKDKNILEKVDSVAFDQEDLADLLDEGIDEIYLCANRFVIPLRMKNKTYIGVCEAVAVIRSKEPVDFVALGIEFQNVSFNDTYRKIFNDTYRKIFNMPIDNLELENVLAAESTIRDADMAKKMTNYTKNNVPSAQAILAQVNKNSSAILSLLQ